MDRDGIRLWRLLVAALMLGVAGCRTNLSEVLLQTGAATGRTLVDLWLTDFANQLADSFEPDDSAPDDDDSTPDISDDDTGQDDDDDLPVDDDGSGGSSGDVAAGEAIYTANSCGTCHCADAAGGCALSAPSIVGAGVGAIVAVLLGDASHPSKVGLSDQGLADLEAYLGSLAEAGG
jgi:hypothetical protein